MANIDRVLTTYDGKPLPFQEGVKKDETGKLIPKIVPMTLRHMLQLVAAQPQKEMKHNVAAAGILVKLAKGEEQTFTEAEQNLVKETLPGMVSPIVVANVCGLVAPSADFPETKEWDGSTPEWEKEEESGPQPMPVPANGTQPGEGG